MTRSVQTWMCILALAVAALPGAAEEAKIAGPAAVELSADLVAEAAPGYLPEDVRTHLRRAVVLSALAARVDPSNVNAWHVRAEAAANIQDFELAAIAQEQFLNRTGGTDHQAGVLWIRYRLASLSTAEARAKMLDGVAADAKRPKPLRAAALANRAAIAEGRGESAKARTFYAEALELDPLQESALNATRRLAADFGPAAEAENRLNLLRGNPLAINVAWELGQLCRGQGLGEQSLLMYEYAESVSRTLGHVPSRTFRRDKLDCLLDAGLYQRAVGEFEGMQVSGVLDVKMAGLLVEAYRQLDKVGQAEALVDQMTDEYRLRETAAKVRGMTAAEIAWFHWQFRQRKSVAANWSDTAMVTSPDEPYVQRVWAVTHLGSPDDAADAKAYRLLTELSSTDLYALTALIEDAFTRGDTAKGRKLLASAELFGRRGPAWRNLERVAAKHGVEAPWQPESAPQVAAAVDTFLGEDYTAMGRAPERFIAIDLKPAAERVPAGESPKVVATLTNIGPAAIPLGVWGLITPRLMLDVRMTVEREKVEVADRVPLAWNAPRYLAPGQTLTQTVAIDTGKIGQALAYRPLSDVTLEVVPMVDPVRQVDGFAPALESVTAPKVTLRRAALADAYDSEAYYEALKKLVRHLQGEDQLQALRAGRLTVAILDMAEQAAAGRTGPAGKLVGKLREPELLSMLRYALTETPPAVRAGTLGAMRGITVTKLMLRLAGPCLVHPSPIVRARAVDVLGSVTGIRAAKLVAPFITEDRDPIVREMAEVVAASIRPKMPTTLPSRSASPAPRP